MIVYLIRCLVNGKGYVGQTIHPWNVRWKKHCSGTRQLIDRAIQKYGADNFETCILARAETLEELNRLEEEHIAKQGTLHPNGYNLLRGGLNRTHLPVTRVKMSAAQMGNTKALGKHYPHSEEHKQKLSAALKGKLLGRPKSAETRAKMSAAQERRSDAVHAKISASLSGHEVSEETREKLRKASTGRHPSAETRAKIGLASKGVPKPKSAETRAKISAALIGRKLSPETIAKRSAAVTGIPRPAQAAAMTGRHHSEETKARIAASNIGKHGRTPVSEIQGNLFTPLQSGGSA
jgi:group I intron endonuclease